MPNVEVEPTHLVPHAGAALGIEAGRGLVEEQDLGVVHQRGHQIEPSLHATRVGRDGAIERLAEVDQLAELLDASGHGRLREPVEQALQAQELAARLLGVEGRVLQRDADPQSHLARLPADVEPGHRGPTRTGRDQRAQHADRGGLARSVGAQEPVDLTSGDLEIDPVDRDVVAEPADQSLGSDGGAGQVVHPVRGPVLTLSIDHDCSCPGVRPCSVERGDSCRWGILIARE